MLKSQWGQGSWKVTGKIQDPKAKELLSMLQALDINLDDPAAMRKDYRDAVAFARFAGPVGARTHYGLLVRAASADLLNQKFTAGADLLAQRQQKAEKLSVMDADGFLTEVPVEGGDPVPVYAVHRGDLAVFATDKGAIEEALQSSPAHPPAFMTSEHYTRTAASMGGIEPYLYGAADLEALLKRQENRQAVAGSEALRMLVLSFGMKETPQILLRLGYDGSALDEQSMLKMSGSSGGAGMAAYVPARPLLFLTFDGQLINGLKQAAAASGQAPDLNFLDSIKRLGIAASVPQAGQTMLPLPDLALIALSSNPDAVAAGIESAFSSTVAGSAPDLGMQWVEQELTPGGQKIKAMSSMFQVGAFLAVKDDAVFVASTKEQLVRLLNKNGADRSSVLTTAEGKAAFSDKPNLLNFYLDFKELAALLENLKSVLSLFAPQAKQAGDLVDQATLQQLSSRGRLIAAVTNQNQMVEAKVNFEPSAQ